MSYDIIGDIHGYADKLEALLRKLGYSERSGCWRHPTRKAIFLGDFIDRGPAELHTVDLARRMVTDGAALAVMGNHELNAIAWHTRDPLRPCHYLRPHWSMRWGRKNYRQHREFLKEVGRNAERHSEIIRWFKTLPLWLDLPGIRVVHACWHENAMSFLSCQLGPGHLLTDDLLGSATREPNDDAEKDTPTLSVFKAVEALLKGIEVPLPPALTFKDQDGNKRNRVRVRWWIRDAVTFRQLADLPDQLRHQLPDDPIPAHSRITVPTDTPIFFGHYWLRGTPSFRFGNLACLDYSAGKGGPLVAYRWDGEANLSEKNLVSTD